jgi:chromosome partitioning protein
MKQPTTLARHAAAELKAAGLPRMAAILSDLVAYGEMTYSGRLSASSQSAAEVAALITEL